MPDVVALGDVNVDIIAHYEAFPASGQDAFAYSIEFHCGGSAANTALTLASLGVETSLIARVGSDPWAFRALENLREAGVLLDSLQCDPMTMTGLMYIIVTPDGERTILGHRGANAATNPSQIRETDFQGARLFHLSGYALLVEPQRAAALQALEMAGRSGLTVTLDPGMSGAGTAVPELRQILPSVDILLPNLAEAQQLSGMVAPEDCVQTLLVAGIQVVALKLGPAGCLVGTHDGLLRVPGFAVEARDSTGAGDSFAAGLIAGFLGGLDWAAATTLGNALGAVTACCAGVGPAAVRSRKAAALLGAHHDQPVYRSFQESVEQVIEFLHAP